MALFVLVSVTEQVLVLPSGDFVVFLVPALNTEKAFVLPTGGFMAPFIPASGTETFFVLPTNIASNVQLRQDNACQGR